MIILWKLPNHRWLCSGGHSRSNDYDLEGLNKGSLLYDAIIVKYDLNGDYVLDAFDPSQRVYTIQEVPYTYESATTYLGDGDDESYEIQLILI